MPPVGQQNVWKRLDSARKSIARTQAQGPTPEDSPQPIYLGGLGNFCDEIARTWEDPAHGSIINQGGGGLVNVQPPPKFAVRHGRDHKILYYLQDAFEVPYWEFMLDLFLQRRVNLTSLSGDVVLRVLDSVKLELLDERCHLLNELGRLSGDTREDVGPILKGIDAWIKLLESVWDGPTSNLYQKHFLLKANVFQASTNVAVATAEEPSRGPGDEARHPTVSTPGMDTPDDTADFLCAENRGACGPYTHLLHRGHCPGLQRICNIDAERYSRKHRQRGFLVSCSKQHHGRPGQHHHGCASSRNVVVFASVWSDVDVFHAGPDICRHCHRDLPIFQHWLELNGFIFWFCCVGSVCPGHDSSGPGGYQSGPQGQDGLKGEHTVFLFRPCLWLPCLFQVVLGSSSI
jgi:hypothetical protein